MKWKSILALGISFLMLFSFAIPLISAQQQESLRLIHASPDAPNLDFYLDGEKIAENVDYAKVIPNLSIAAGERNLEIYPAGKKEQPLLSKKLDVKEGQRYTATVVGRVNDDNPDLQLDLLFLEDLTEIPAGRTKVRATYISPDAPSIQIVEKGGPVLFERIQFKQVTDYKELAPKNYTFQIKLFGAQESLLDLTDLDLKADTAYTIYILDVKGEPTLQAIVISDKGEVLQTLLDEVKEEKREQE